MQPVERETEKRDVRLQRNGRVAIVVLLEVVESVERQRDAVVLALRHVGAKIVGVESQIGQEDHQIGGVSLGLQVVEGAPYH
ncbi:hypothetical protein Ade02nite_29080 [Paractinoplanes deccanensis]|uniref:Uncharacterized protein n=1 Tax=Paractinoplanes deccanensis TaxID=113561 RepID=A0ABQ3Y2Q5_9ACTN|nr:hypothetical protein [Actinoplanes deccanensis]GID74267.1 hypothetical protein Ade02nite_29080 [Actinoplanes deccanensis]